MVSSAEERGENRKAGEIAKNLLNMDISIESIVAATGLTIDEINRIR